MPNRIPFTTRSVDALQPRRTRYYRYDARTPALAVCVHPSGVKTFYRAGRQGGRYVREKIGVFPAVSVQQAQKACAKISGRIANGERRALNRSTLGGLWAYYLDHHAKRYASWQRDERRWTKHLKRYANRRLESFTTDELQSLVDSVRKKLGPYAGNHLRAQLHTMFRLAVRKGWVTYNPVSAVERFPVRSRERFLLPAEISRFFTALERVARPTTRDFFAVALFTGARRSNVCAMRWDEIDWSTSVWRIPADKSKNRESMTIVLPPPALEILQRRRDEALSPEWVFPGGGKSGHLVEPKAAWRALLEDAGIEDLRIHDLRRTLGSWQAAGGASLLVIGKSLGHKSTAATMVYSRLQLDPVRASVTAATQAILAAAAQGSVNHG